MYVVIPSPPPPRLERESPALNAHGSSRGEAREEGGGRREGGREKGRRREKEREGQRGASRTLPTVLDGGDERGGGKAAG